jgi:hypothetical protein
VTATNLTIILIFICVVALVIESTILSFPFVFFIGSFLLVMMKKIRLYIIVFILAFIADALRVSNFGLTPLFLLGSILLVMLYEKYSGSNDFLVAAIIIAMGGFIYAHLLSYSLPLTISFYIALFLGFFIVSKLNKRKRILL